MPQEYFPKNIYFLAARMFFFFSAEFDVEIAAQVLAAAHKYKVRGLKVIVEKVICENLNVENAIKILILSKTYQAIQLVNKSLRFVLENFG